jgi:RimJ/RimL family protein N-acetyltransferase
MLCAVDSRHVRTGRLRLDAVTDADVDALYRLNSDPAVWWHFPSGRHTERSTTLRLVDRFVEAWARDGLGYWVARCATTGEFLGAGGCMGAPSDARSPVVWSLYYRFAPAAHGRGYATELARAAIECARRRRPDLPVIATLLEHNVASRGVAERAGLTLQWTGPDPGNPDAVRLILADRKLAAGDLEILTGG